MEYGLVSPTPLTLGVIFFAGLLTSFGPCSLSLMPVTLAYLAGFNDNGYKPWTRSLIFSVGIVLAMVCLGLTSGIIGHVYGQIPQSLSICVAILSVVMGLNLLGIIKLPLPPGPDPEKWRRKMPHPLAPLGAGLAFGLAASPCITPVLAVLLSWIAKSGRPLTGVLLLACFGAGQVLPLLIAGMAAANLPRLLLLRPLGNRIPALSGMIFVICGTMSLLTRWN
uniref:Putative c-type cytochrome biogenesis protein CcdA n=1 Tax=Paulinella longichromatophora TaxID=1708747 RepID=A0A2H4ZNR5_9EUKA|nr:putative c-type cytochrome biogenesis protein CcdA [Paulinella longichromatophora]